MAGTATSQIDRLIAPLKAWTHCLCLAGIGCAQATPCMEAAEHLCLLHQWVAKAISLLYEGVQGLCKSHHLSLHLEAYHVLPISDQTQHCCVKSSNSQLQ